MGIMYDPYVNVCNSTWNNSAVPPGWSTCNVWVSIINYLFIFLCLTILFLEVLNDRLK
jgi:hypothetical protein